VITNNKGDIMITSIITNIAKYIILQQNPYDDTSNDFPFKIGFGNAVLIAILISIAMISSSFIMAYWVRKDLIKRNKKSLIYPAVVFFTNIAGFLFYLFARYNEKCILAEDDTACDEDMEYIEHFERDLKEEVDKEVDEVIV
jgi:hypothetical protein